MSHNNCILTLLDLKDKNITFSENWMEDVQIKKNTKGLGLCLTIIVS